MPDGDIVHPTLSARYYNVYKQVCEGAYSDEELSREALRSLKKDVKEFGNEPIQLIEQESALFEEITVRQQLGEEIDWAQERKNIKEVAQQVNGSKRAIQLVVRACEQQLHLLQRELVDPGFPHNFFLELSQGYLLKMYDAQFAKKAEQTRHHYNQANPALVSDKLRDIRPFVIRGIATLTDQIIKRGDVHVLRLPTRSTKMRKINLNTDLDRDLSELL